MSVRTARIGLVALAAALFVVALFGADLHAAAKPGMWDVKRVVPAMTVGAQEAIAQAIVFVPIGWLLVRAFPRSGDLALPVGLLLAVVVASPRQDFFTQPARTVIVIIAYATGLSIGLVLAAIRGRTPGRTVGRATDTPSAPRA